MAVTLGVDVARSGSDKTVIAVRRDNAIMEIHRYAKQDTMATVGRVIEQARLHHAERIVVDVNGVGAGVFDRLREQDYPVIAFNSAARATERDSSGQMSFLNRRAAAWWRLRELLDPASGADVSLPDDDLLLGDLTAVHWKVSSGGRIQIEGKDGIRGRLGRSPDTADAVAMAFWEAGSEDWYRAELERMEACPRCGGDFFVLYDDRMWRCAGCRFVAEEGGVTPARDNRLF